VKVRDRVLGNIHDNVGYDSIEVRYVPTEKAKAWEAKWHEVTGLDIYEDRLANIKRMLIQGQRLAEFIKELLCR
jgi:hypothetical protein